MKSKHYTGPHFLSHTLSVVAEQISVQTYICWFPRCPFNENGLRQIFFLLFYKKKKKQSLYTVFFYMQFIFLPKNQRTIGQCVFLATLLATILRRTKLSAKILTNDLQYHFHFCFGIVYSIAHIIIHAFIFDTFV